MSAAGTPSTDPWVILARERARYEEQFKSLKPSNGIITGDQAKGFFLQSQLPPLVLGQIWALADTDADGKMDINEFSIACKLINLKLRGFEVPKGVPPSLLASLKVMTPPAVPPLPNAGVIAATTPPSRPAPPKIVPQVPPPPQNHQPLIGTAQPIMSNGTPSLINTGSLVNATSAQPLINGPQMVPGMTGMGVTPNSGMQGVPLSGMIPATGVTPTGIVHPVNMAGVGVGVQNSMIPTGIVQPMAPIQPMVNSTPLVNPPMARPTVPPQPGIYGGGMGAPLVSTVPSVPGIPPMPFAAPLVSGMTVAPTPLVTAISNTSITSGPISPAGSLTGSVTGSLTGIPSVLPVAGPGATSTPRASVTSLERTGSIDFAAMADWAIPQATKLKYTQIFNTTDRTRSGFLSGAQARNVMVQSRLPQNVLAQIWGLSDMDADGRLGCEEFVLAMHLCEQAAMGHPPPTKLPPDLIPPSFRRPARTASVSSQGSIANLDQDPASTLLQTSFEDKRKENYEKGQAELERRRKQLLDQQKKEAEERERKEREEADRREKARLEAERKRQEEIDKQMREQQEKERLIEEERKRQLEQKEAARKEMERQRQLEWEKQRLQELQQRRDTEQANVLKLKAKNQSLTIELSTLNDQVRELSQKICDTRVGVSNVKTTIDGMRTTRDTQMSEMSKLKNQLKEQNAKLLAISQEKAKLEAKSKAGHQEDKQAYENREINIKNLREQIADYDTQIASKETDIENSSSQLDELKNQLNTLITECRTSFKVYEEKRNKVLEAKNATRALSNFDEAWGPSEAWGGADNDASSWPADDKWTDNTAPPEFEQMPGVHKYRAIYEFNARNNDEISFQPGDIVYVPEQQTGEPGWLAGEIRGKTGWFPESYCEPVDGIGIAGASGVVAIAAPVPEEAKVEPTKLEEISETIEATTVSQVTAEPTVAAAVTSPPATQLEGEPEYYIASYPYQSTEPGDLNFNAGELIAVYKKEGDWWTGKVNDNVGIFPSNYVQKVDVSQPAVASAEPAVAPAEPPFATNLNQGVSAAAVTSALESFSSEASAASDLDSEVSAININKMPEKPFDANSGVQVMKSKKPEIASVIAPYQASSDGQLSLARGQLIMIRKKTDSGWWEGELQAKGRKRQVGWFPASYVKVLNSSGKISGRTTPVSTSRMQQEIVIDKVVALYPYTALNPDELSFLKDDIINVTAREEEAWWRGELNGVSGLFPSNYVAPLQQQSTTRSNKKRQDAIRELVETEKAYVQDMSIVYEVFEQPLRKSQLISIKEIDEIFVNWQEILNCNKSFFEDLNHAWNRKSQTIGDVICRHLPLMTAYITFCGKQLDSAALLQNLTENSTSFRELVRKCQNNVQTKGMPLSSFLIKPMQRITKYPLLIGKILEHTPADHPDYKLLKEALRIAEGFVNGVNENVRIKQNHERMDWLQQHVQNDLDLRFDSITNKMGPRQILHFGVLTKVKNNKELIGFLFNDMLMLIQPSKHIGSQFTFQRNSNISYKMYKQPILIQYLSVSRESTESVESGTDWNRVLKLQDDKSSYKINVLASTVHECNSWVKKIDAAKEAYEKIDKVNKQNKRKTQLQLGPACGRLLVLVQKGKRLMQSGKPHSEQVYCKVNLGIQEQETDYAKDTLTNGNMPNTNNGAPQTPALVWNHSMQFQLRSLNEEVLSFVILEYNPYSADEFLGRADLKLADIYRESQNTNGPLIKKLILHQVSSGELTVKLDLHMFNNF